MKILAVCLLLIILIQSVFIWSQHYQIVKVSEERNFFERQFNTSLHEASQIVDERDELRAEVKQLKALYVK